VTADGKVVLNLATAEDLRRLPGIGPAKAAAILATRARLKRFRKVEDLLLVKGIGRRSLKRLRPLVLVDPPAP
jgi:competence protein ComEA